METGYQMPQTMESTLCELSIVMNNRTGAAISGACLISSQPSGISASLLPLFIIPCFPRLQPFLRQFPCKPQGNHPLKRKADPPVNIRWFQ